MILSETNYNLYLLYLRMLPGDWEIKKVIIDGKHIGFICHRLSLGDKNAAISV